MSVTRADTSTLGRWWWTVDRPTLIALFLLVGAGFVLMLAASPAVAVRIGAASRDAFIGKQVVFLALGSALMIGVSLLSPRQVKQLALLGCVTALALTAATLVVGPEVKGARRWLSLPGFQLQPSEFLKPCLAIVCAWLISLGHRPGSRFPGALAAFGLFAVAALLLKLQPDIGMLMVVAAVLFAQLFVNGLNMVAVVGMAGAGLGLFAAAYALLPHVQSRVARFLDPAAGDTYQVDVALEAFGNGGLFGRGPGEGRIKTVLPDAHADFVFAVAGEEFGFILCIILILIFAFIVVRGLLRLLGETDRFTFIAATGLLTQFGLQAFVNMASTLHLIPTKGMTLPFVSYGGSSVLAIALGMGFLLALTRRRVGSGGKEA